MPEVKTMSYKEQLKYGLIGGPIIILVFFLVMVSRDATFVSPDTSPTPTQVAQATTAPQTYKKIAADSGKSVDNLRYLLTESDLSETDVKAIAEAIQRNECKKQCNIFLFDDQKAAELDIAYSKLSDSSAMTKWKVENYVFVAEHNVGQLVFGDYTHYPLKDWYYDQQKAKNK